MMPSIMSGSLIRATPPWARMSAGTRSSAITATAPASSAIFACSGVTTSMITPPLSISAMPRLTRVPVPVDGSACGATGCCLQFDRDPRRRILRPVQGRDSPPGSVGRAPVQGGRAGRRCRSTGAAAGRRAGRISRESPLPQRPGVPAPRRCRTGGPARSGWWCPRGRSRSAGRPRYSASSAAPGRGRSRPARGRRRGTAGVGGEGHEVPPSRPRRPDAPRELLGQAGPAAAGCPASSRRGDTALHRLSRTRVQAVHVTRSRTRIPTTSTRSRASRGSG